VSLPTREELLKILDTEPKSRAKISTILADLPPEFPSVESWSQT